MIKVFHIIEALIIGIGLGYLWCYNHNAQAMKQLTAIQIQQAYNMQPNNYSPDDTTVIIANKLFKNKY